jgi:GNAT superfamily N-acetyltransferase
MLALQGGVMGLSSDRAREILESAIAASECLVHVEASNEVNGLVITNARAFFGRDFVKLLIVAPTHRRTGIGHALLEAAVSQTGTATIFSSTNESNAAMRALFEHDGWTLSGVLSGIDEGDPEMVFWRAR